MTPPDLLNLAAGAAVLGLASLTAAMGYGLRTRAAGLLTAFFACFALAHLFGTFLLGGGAWLSAEAVRWLRVVEVPLVYLLGPLLYGYAVALTTPGRWPGYRALRWHLLPAAVAFGISLLNAIAPFDATPTGAAVFLFSFHAWLLQGARTCWPRCGTRGGHRPGLKRRRPARPRPSGYGCAAWCW